MPKSRVTQRKDGRYAMQIYLGRKPDGGRIYKTVYGQTPKEVENKALEVRLLLKKGIDVTAERDTFGYWADQWKKIKSAETTAKNMVYLNQCLDKLSDLYDMSFVKLKPIDFQRIFDGLAAGEGVRKPLAKKTLIGIKGVAHQICQLAIVNRVLDFNPASAIVIPATKPPKKRTALTDEQIQWIIDTPHRAQLPAMIMLFAGLRRGEVIPLTWDDIDLDNHTISVNKSVVTLNGKCIVKPGAKTEAGVRTIDIPQILVDFLQKKQKPQELVCPAVNGRMMNDIGWRRMWDSYLTELNLKYGDFGDSPEERPKSKYDPKGLEMVIPRFTAHCLRHTFATMLYHAGIDVLTAKEQLGHTDIKTTLGIYTHLDNQFKRKSMDKLDSYIDGKNKDASQMQVK